MLRNPSNLTLLIIAAVLGVLYLVGSHHKMLKVQLQSVKLIRQLEIKEAMDDLHEQAEQLQIDRASVYETVKKVEAINNRRKEKLQKACEQYGMNETISAVRSFVKNPVLKTSLFFSDKYKIMFCIIPKCASTNMAKFIAVIDGIVSEREPGKLGGNYAAGIVRKKRSVRQARNIEEIVNRMDSYKKFVLVREPFSRLLSAYRNKLENNTRGDSYARLAKRLYEQYGKGKGLKDVSLNDFIEYVTERRNRAQRDGHWNFYSTLCSPCSLNYDYIAHMETLDDDMMFLMDSEKIEGVSFPPSYNSFTDNEKVKKYFGEASPKLVNDLFHTYKADFELFDFPPPPQF